MKRLEGRVAVITGAGSGIGYATAKRFADEGAKVVVVDMNAETGNAVAKEVGGIFVSADVTNEEQVHNDEVQGILVCMLCGLVLQRSMFSG